MKNSIKETGIKLITSQKIRFGLVGGVNTLADFAVLNILVGVFGMPLVASNILSTTVAMCVSFTLNKKAVFRGSEKGGTKQVVSFFAVTLVGIWLIQTSVLAFAHTMLIQLTPLPDMIAINIAKVIGICVGLVWNYLWYSRYVFKSGSRHDK